MRVSAPIADYMHVNFLTTKGDLVVRGIAIPERLVAPPWGKVLTGDGVANIPYWENLFNLLTTPGDIWVRGAVDPERLAAGAVSTYLQGKGAGLLPAYERTMPPLATKGDIIVQGVTVPDVLPSSSIGTVLRSQGIGELPYYANLFNLLTTVGDLWVRGASEPEQLAAGADKTYLKGQGAGVTPVYGKTALSDTGVKIANNTRATTGNQVITGVGFKPSIVIFMAECGVNTEGEWSIGFSDGTVNMCLYKAYDGTMGVYLTRCGMVIPTMDNYYEATIISVDSDGFEIAWVKSNSPPTVNFVYLCLP